MAAYGIAPRLRRANDLAAGPPEVELFARIEGLSGEEAALLAIPANERNQHQRDRLRAIAGELDRAWHLLRERAERLGLRDSSERGRA
jgi:hypothetical protein